jgi:hypothetical protein
VVVVVVSQLLLQLKGEGKINLSAEHGHLLIEARSAEAGVLRKQHQQLVHCTPQFVGNRSQGMKRKEFFFSFGQTKILDEIVVFQKRKQSLCRRRRKRKLGLSKRKRNFNNERQKTDPPVSHQWEEAPVIRIHSPVVWMLERKGQAT